MRQFFVLSLVGATAFALASGDVVVNSGFERLGAPSDPFFVVSGSTALPGWTVAGGTASQGVDIRSRLFGPEGNVAAGRQSVHLGGTNGPGSIKQTFAIDPLKQYIFAYSSSGLGYSGNDTWSCYINGGHYFDAGQENQHWYWSEILVGPMLTSSIELEFRSLVPNNGVLLDEIHWFPYGKALMIGTVELEDFVGNSDGQLATFEFRSIPNGDLITSQTVALEPGGRFELLLDPPGHCDVTVKTSHWLSYTVANQNIGANYDSYYFVVANGDCDEDNEVGIGDYARLSAAYNAIPGDGNWDANADLNGDESVDIGDYAILSQNYGDVGS